MKRILAIAATLTLGLISMQAQIKVTGHRGCRFNTPDAPETPYYENTIEALKYVQKVGIDQVEFDVQLTSDEQVIVFHGPKIPGSGKNVQKVTFEEARNTVLPGGHRMPTLEEYIKQAMKHPEIPIIVEIKPQATPERETMLVEKTMAIADKMKIGAQLQYTSFSEWACNEIHRIQADAKVIFLQSGVNVNPPEWAAARGYNGISYDMNGFMNHPEYIARAKALGIETTLWIVNDYQVVQWAILNGIDCLTSDHPERIKAYVDGVKASMDK